MKATKLFSIAMAMMVLFAFAISAMPQKSSVSWADPVGHAQASDISDDINASMESYVPTMLTIIFIVLIVGFILVLGRLKP